jgi:hypothetical protein
MTTPQDKPLEPDHPMQLDGLMAPGDVSLMARCMIEEMLQVGIAPDHLVAMTRNSEYQALYAARCTLGDPAMDKLLADTFGRIGAHRHRTVESTTTSTPTSLTIKTT